MEQPCYQQADKRLMDAGEENGRERGGDHFSQKLGALIGWGSSRAAGLYAVLKRVKESLGMEETSMEDLSGWLKLYQVR